MLTHDADEPVGPRHHRAHGQGQPQLPEEPRYAVADKKVVFQFQTGLKLCYPKLRMASPYSDEWVGDLSEDGIYGPNTRDHIKFHAFDQRHCHAY